MKESRKACWLEGGKTGGYTSTCTSQWLLAWGPLQYPWMRGAHGENLKPRGLSGWGQQRSEATIFRAWPRSSCSLTALELPPAHRGTGRRTEGPTAGSRKQRSRPSVPFQGASHSPPETAAGVSGTPAPRLFGNEHVDSEWNNLLKTLRHWDILSTSLILWQYCYF